MCDILVPGVDGGVSLCETMNGVVSIWLGGWRLTPRDGRIKIII